MSFFSTPNIWPPLSTLFTPLRRPPTNLSLPPTIQAPTKKCTSLSVLRAACAVLMTIGLIFLSNLLAFVIFSEQKLQPVELIPEFRFTARPTHRSNYSKGLFTPPTLDQSGFRAYMSIFPDVASDGMGNGFTTVNYDFLMAHLLNVTYIHRDARYGSLSPDNDPAAIERLFGWDEYGYIRSNVSSEICSSVEMREAPNCVVRGNAVEVDPANSPVCAKLPKKSPFKRVVTIPKNVSDCLINRMTSECRLTIIDFSKRHAEKGTLFQLAPDKCGNIYRNPDFRRTGEWFRKTYWERHEKSTGMVKRKGVTRVLNGFDSDQIQMAVHIRRGDFFTAKSRVLIGDGVYADVIGTVTCVVRRLVGGGAGLRVTVYSEGVAKEGEEFFHDHDISRTDKIYVDENETRHGDGREHWEGSLRDRGAGDVEVSMEVGTDTIDAIHGMACADVFVGSMSSLSRTLVGELARGVVIEPSTREMYEEISSKGDWRIYYVYDDAEGPVVDERDIENRFRLVFGENGDEESEG